MRYSTAAVVLGLGGVPAYADFIVYLGSMNFLSDGGPMSGQLLDLFNNPPSCDDAGSHPPIFMNLSNDAGISGFSCDGCNAGVTVPEMDITRLETPHEFVWSMDTGSHLTLYISEDGGYGLFNAQMEQWGTCERIIENSHLLECAWATDFANLWHAFSCTSELTIPDSN